MREVLIEDFKQLTERNIPWNELRDKTFLITGATGLVSSLLVRCLLYANETINLNAKVYAVVRNTDKADRIFEDEKTDALSYIVADLATEKVCCEGECDYIIHAAAVTASKLMVSDPVGTIRTSIDGTEKMLDEDLTAIPDDQVLLRSNNSLGHGIMNEIHDIIYVKTDDYSASHNQEIAWEIEKLNQQFLDEGRNYVLVGPGRWGSSDTWLGIPVKWPHISAARVIVEAGLTNYRVDPSQGTHFFQNLTSFGVGYFTINAFMNDGVYNQEFLNAQPAVHETKYLRHVHFRQPMVVKMDGKKKLGVVLMPEE